MNHSFNVFSLTVLGTLFALQAQAASQLENLFQQEISKRNYGFEVELASPPLWQSFGDDRTVTVNRVVYSGETQPGIYLLQVETVRRDGTTELLQSTVSYRVFARTWVPIQRVIPGQILHSTDVREERMNVTTGSLASLKSLILSPSQQLEGFEANQTLIENQPILKTAVQKCPDVRRGDSVRIKMLSGDVTLTTRGQAEEPAYLNHKVRVTSAGTKRLLEGTLREDGIVEVRL